LNFQRRRSAEFILERLAGKIPALSLRELLEAALGLKASRLQVSRQGLDALDDISRHTGLGACLAEYRVLTEINSGRGAWNDRIVARVGLDDARGDYLVYVAEDQDTAEQARVFDALGDDNQFGELLAIPDCCRAFYSRYIRDSYVADPLWVVAERCEDSWRVPQGANICAQYFERGFLSHFPCDLGCSKSRGEARRRSIEVGEICESFAAWLAEACGWSYLILRQGLAAMKANPLGLRSCRVTEFMGMRGTVPSWIQQCEILSFTGGQLTGTSVSQIDEGRGDEAIMIITTQEW
jgi:hypothetical protein